MRCYGVRGTFAYSARCLFASTMLPRFLAQALAGCAKELVTLLETLAIRESTEEKYLVNIPPLLVRGVKQHNEAPVAHPTNARRKEHVLCPLFATVAQDRLEGMQLKMALLLAYCHGLANRKRKLPMLRPDCVYTTESLVANQKARAEIPI